MLKKKATHHSQSRINNKLLPDHVSEEAAQRHAGGDDQRPQEVHAPAGRLVEVVHAVERAVRAERLGFRYQLGL